MAEQETHEETGKVYDPWGTEISPGDYGRSVSGEVGLSPGQTAGVVRGEYIVRPVGSDIYTPYYIEKSGRTGLNVYRDVKTGKRISQEEAIRRGYETGWKVGERYFRTEVEADRYILMQQTTNRQQYEQELQRQREERHVPGWGVRAPERPPAEYVWIQRGKLIEKYLYEPERAPTFRKHGIFGGEEIKVKPGMLYKQDIFGFTTEEPRAGVTARLISPEEARIFQASEFVASLGLLATLTPTSMLRGGSLVRGTRAISQDVKSAISRYESPMVRDVAKVLRAGVTRGTEAVWGTERPYLSEIGQIKAMYSQAKVLIPTKDIIKRTGGAVIKDVFGGKPLAIERSIAKEYARYIPSKDIIATDIFGGRPLAVEREILKQYAARIPAERIKGTVIPYIEKARKALTPAEFNYAMRAYTEGVETKIPMGRRYLRIRPSERIAQAEKPSPLSYIIRRRKPEIVKRGIRPSIKQKTPALKPAEFTDRVNKYSRFGRVETDEGIITIRYKDVGVKRRVKKEEFVDDLEDITAKLDRLVGRSTRTEFPRGLLSPFKPYTRKAEKFPARLPSATKRTREPFVMVRPVFKKQRGFAVIDKRLKTAQSQTKKLGDELRAEFDKILKESQEQIKRRPVVLPKRGKESEVRTKTGQVLVLKLKEPEQVKAKAELMQKVKPTATRQKVVVLPTALEKYLRSTVKYQTPLAVKMFERSVVKVAEVQKSALREVLKSATAQKTELRALQRVAMRVVTPVKTAVKTTTLTKTITPTITAQRIIQKPVVGLAPKQFKSELEKYKNRKKRGLYMWGIRNPVPTLESLLGLKK